MIMILVDMMMMLMAVAVLDIVSKKEDPGFVRHLRLLRDDMSSMRCYFY